MNNTKTQDPNTIPSLGILGLGSRSTTFYIELLNEYYNHEVGGYSTCPLLMVNSNFDEINPYLPNHYDKLEPALTFYLNQCEKLSIEQLIIPNITLHECYDRLFAKNNAPDIEIIHPVKATTEELKKDDHQKITLIGSYYTMQSLHLISQFTDHHISVDIPEEINEIDKIRQLVYNNQASSDDIQRFNALVKHYLGKGPVVIACTELSIAIDSALAQQPIDTSNKHLYDMARIQAMSALKVSGLIK